MASALSASLSTAIPGVVREVSGSANSTATFKSFSGLRSNGAMPSLAATRGISHVKQAQRLTVRAATAVATKFKTLKPLGDRILVKISTKEEKTQGGILLPTAAQTKPQGGEVVAVGEGRSVGDKKVPISIPEGSTIVYSKYAGTEVEFNGTEHLLLKEDDVVGLLSTDDVKDLQPSNDRVLIKVTEAEGQTAGGVLLTESAKEKPVIGEVVAAGPGPIGEDGSRKGLEVAPGNMVLYSKYAGNDFKSKDGSQYVVLRANDVLAVLS